MRLFAIFRGVLRDALDADGKKIVNLGTPTQDGDAANKKYVDENAGANPSWENIRNKPDSFPPSPGKLPLRALPKYLHILAFDDTYIEDARAWYETHANDSLGGCSAVRKGGLLGRNYDWNFDEMAEFVVKVSAKDGRHASVGVANVRTELTEEIVCSGVFSPLYRVLPGRTVDGINDAGVVAEVNVIPRDAEKDPVKSATRNLHAFEVVRHVLDNYANAHDAAVYVAAHYYIPSGDYSYHWMIADANGTYIVEDGAVIDTETTMTNYRVGVADDPYGNGYARRTILGGTGTVADLLEAVKFTNAYASGWPWPDEFASADAGITHGETDALKAWADTYVTPLIDPATRKPKARGNGCWQTCHSCIYDFAAKTMAICVQEDFAKRYVFAAGGAKVELEDTVTETSANGVKSSGIWSWVKSLLPSWLTPTREEPPTRASVAAKYTKPSGGIPKTDLAEEVQASLDKSVKMNESGIASVRQMMVGPNDAQAAYDSEYIYTGDGGYYFPWSEHYAEIAPSHRFAVVSQIEPKADRSSIAPEYDAESAYTVGQFVYHDGKIYQCTTAIAAPGESWNPAHWAERKVDDFFKEDNSLLTGVIDARLPYPINTAGTILDRQINVVTSGAFVIPEGFKDLLIRYTGVPASLTFSGTDASIADYGDDLPTETGDYLITVTRTNAAECYIRIIKLEARA